jgi:hypothetical protein
MKDRTKVARYCVSLIFITASLLMMRMALFVPDDRRIHYSERTVRVVVTALGPSLLAFGVNNALPG